MSPIEEKTTIWDTLKDYQRRHPESVNPPSERINPDIPGSYLWVILVTNWQNLHPLIQDVLYVWYRELSKLYGGKIEELDPKSTEALLARFEELDSKLKAYELERSNLEQELMIRDRDFQRLRSVAGKREKENIEVQQMLGKSFQEKIMDKQKEIDEKEEIIQQLKAKIATLEQRVASSPTTEDASQNKEVSNLKQQLEHRTKLLREVSEELQKLNQQVKEQQATIEQLNEKLRIKDEKIREIKGLLKL
ncbi:MAG: hypothetical protein DRP02_11310 [Candidatus Gerdarchaeota archaeon]|nr:MAG: hypothetical protein DRP02_11310 [Candidatus Gerdarchaeota archaeon]